MIEAVEFKKEHLEDIAPKQIFMEDPFFYNLAAARSDLEKGYACTFMHKDGVAAVFGGNKPWDGLFDVYAVLSDLVYKAPVAFHKSVLSIIETYAEALEINRMQFIVRSDFVEGQKWARSLGFKKESTMLKYGPIGQNFDLFVRFDFKWQHSQS